MHWVQLDFNKVNKTKQVVGAKSAHQFFLSKIVLKCGRQRKKLTYNYANKSLYCY